MSEDAPSGESKIPKRLVSEARPISWEHLSEFEKTVVEEADAWVDAVANDSANKKASADEIDETRSGRVLFIGGPRGAGKTSILLTLLKRWRARSGTPDVGMHIFLPVLDFDPMPRGMPLHAWLLEPWRKYVRKKDAAGGRSDPDSPDLSERFSDLFDRVINGWTPTHPEGKGVVEKSIAYQEQASGWLETQEEWNRFVGATLCREHQCPKQNCNHDHKYLFLIAIDDVDLQVEHLPQLLHAIRLLRHPNVAYVLTGNFDHLRFAMKLDYIGRHVRLMDSNRLSENIAVASLTDIEAHSARLCDAFLEKALPPHARLALPHLTFKDVRTFSVGGASKVQEKLDPAILVAIPPEAQDLPIVTARQAQHAVDRRLTHGGSAEKRRANTLQFIADLCGTTIRGSEFALGGALTTELGQIIRFWNGDRLKLVLTGQPSLCHQDLADIGTSSDEDEASAKAHRALFVQFLIEMEGQAVAHALEWAPDAGILSTQVEWDPSSKSVDRIAVFHWPWLVRPSAHQALSLGTFSQELAQEMKGNSLNDVSDSLLTRWLFKNIDWWLETRPGDGQSPKGVKTRLPLGEFTRRLKLLRKDNSSEITEEVDRWARELCVMTAPYFGLPARLGRALRQAVQAAVPPLALQRKRIREEEDKLVGDAITARSKDSGRSLREASRLEPTEAERATQTELFLRQREARAPKDDGWWRWLQPPAKKGS